MTLTAERLREVLTYDPETGAFRWLAKPTNGVQKGAAAGYVKSDGYVGVTIDGHAYAAHRLAFLWMTGLWPEKHVDHKNRIKTDNRWENLRDASRSQNLGNQKLHSNNRSGAKGVWFDRRLKKWRAGCADKYLGCFETMDAARAAYQEAAALRFGEFARL